MEEEIEINEIPVIDTSQANKAKNTLPNLFPPGSQLTPDKVYTYI